MRVLTQQAGGQLLIGKGERPGVQLFRRARSQGWGYGLLGAVMVGRDMEAVRCRCRCR